MSQKSNRIIYLDNNATTPLDVRVYEAMRPYFMEEFGNAASIDHRYGSTASEAVDSSRREIAAAIGAKPDEIIFTSGATESDNLAIQGVMERYKDRGDHMITCVTEHEAVLSTAKHLESVGKKVTYLQVDELGHISMEELGGAITDKTVLISIMAANNEIGTIHDIAKIGKLAHDRNVLFHTDAAQTVGHLPMDVRRFNIDLMSFSAHKMYGPKGIGALYVRGSVPHVRLQGIMHGGGQERNIRPGTLNVPAIVGLAKAASIAAAVMDGENAALKKQAVRMLDVLEPEGALLNGDDESRLTGNLNVCFPGVEGKAVINSISDRIAISAGSACTTQSVEPSHVLMALGFGEERAHSSIRIGMGRFTEHEDAEVAARTIADTVRKLRNINIHSV